MTKSLIRESTKLRQAFKERWKDLKLSQQKVANDANKRGQKGINRQGISKYLTNPYAPGALNDAQIMWLSYRYGIYVTLTVGVPESLVKYVVPAEFNEVEALKKLKIFFPETV